MTHKVVINRPRKVSRRELLDVIKKQKEAIKIAEDYINSIKKRFLGCEELLKIQCDHGNWNANSYLFGMANGMILIQHQMSDQHDKLEPKYLIAPEKFLDDIESGNKPVAVETATTKEEV